MHFLEKHDLTNLVQMQSGALTHCVEVPPTHSLEKSNFVVWYSSISFEYSFHDAQQTLFVVVQGSLTAKPKVIALEGLIDRFVVVESLPVSDWREKRERFFSVKLWIELHFIVPFTNHIPFQ
jgi:hypothetical protein